MDRTLFLHHELQLRSLEIIEELKLFQSVSAHVPRFVQVGEAAQVLLSRFRVAHPQQLGLVSSLSELPLLAYVEDINRRVGLFLQSYIASHEILCYRDMESDLLQHLSLYAVPTLTETAAALGLVRASESRRVDPCEIDLDLEGDTAAQQLQTNESKQRNIRTSFVDYGLGALCTHPLVLSLFGASFPLTFSRNQAFSEVLASLPSATQVHSLLRDHLMSLEERDASFSLDHFSRFLSHSLSANTHSHSHLHPANILASVGVVLQNSLHLTLSFTREILRKQRLRESELLRAQFEDARANRYDKGSDKDKEKERERIRVSVPVLREPNQNASLSQFLECVRERAAGESAFSPSLAKIRDAVRAIVSENQHGNDAESQRNKKRKKEHSISSSITKSSVKGVAMEAVVEAAAEYALLHLGRRRDVAKRFLTDNEVDQEKMDDKAEQETEQRDADNDEDEVDEQENQHQDEEEDPEMEATKDPNGNNAEEKRFITGKERKSQDIADCIESERAEPADVLVEGDLLFEESSKRKILPTIESRFALSLPLSVLRDQTLSELVEEISADRLLPLACSLLHLLRPTNNAPNHTSDAKEMTAAVGRFGEALVHLYLQSTLPTHYAVEWLNEESESKASYDMVISPSSSSSSSASTAHKKSTVFVEVKTTRFADRNVFDLSWWEWQFATSLPKVNFHVYRLQGVGELLSNNGACSGLKIVVLKDIEALVKLGRVKLCLAV